MRFRPRLCRLTLTVAAAALALGGLRARADDEPHVIVSASDGSGTSWLPASSPMPGHHWRVDDWALMLHYDVSAGVTLQNSPPGADSEGLTTNWIMGMAQWRKKGTLTLRTMLALEAPFIGRDGYPLVLQTGETANGVPLVDRQHPHDLFMEIAAKYDLPVGKTWGFSAYLAPVGEPALGPTAFPHRVSAATDPLAPIGHHWEDSTHVSFGVVTAGFFWSRVKIEGSWFNGREPDEHRYNFDFAPLDSYSARVSWAPTDEWSLQASWGHLVEPEQLEPGVNQNRATASATYNRAMEGGNWASTFVWGRDMPSDGPSSNALLAETSYVTGPHAIFGRAEWVQKPGHEFALTGPDAETIFPVGEFSVGYSHLIASFSGVDLAGGVRGSMGFVTDALEPHYGTGHPLSGLLFLNLHPAPAGHHHH